jgi:hypothetical protein
MPNYQESTAYARERLARIEDRYQYSYSRDYYITRAANSSTRRMTNLTKLHAWELVLREAGYESAANYASNRRQALESGAITPPVRRRLGRTRVARYVAAPLRNPDATGRSYVEYEYHTGTDDV